MKLPVIPRRTVLDKDLKRIVHLENAVVATGQDFVKVGVGLLFLVAIWVSATVGYYDIRVFPLTEHAALIVAASIVGGYMALNIGANDVANNVGPAVGSKALTMTGALIIAAIFETAGAMLAGGDVVSTVKSGIINPALIPDSDTFILVMISALLAAAMWLNLATYVGAPVSTTHSIVGSVMGAGIVASSFDTVNWITVGKIAASWVISPVMGGLIAAALLAVIKFAIYNADDMIAAAKRWVPLLVTIMTTAFVIYLMMKGLKNLWKPQPWIIAVAGAATFVASYALITPVVARKAARLERRRKAVKSLFITPLIISAALLSFAHGANDVANAIGPLAAIVDAATSNNIGTKVGIPFWVMAVGAVGITAGLALFGPKLIRTVGEQITKLDPPRAFCVALSAAITVIIASALGLPVSSTHIAVGGIFGVGFLREYVARLEREARSIARATKEAKSSARKPTATPDPMSVNWQKQRKKLYKLRKRMLIRRQHLLTIVAAWLITVPLSAVLAAILFLILRGLS